MDKRWSERQIKKRIDDIKSTDVKSTDYHILRRDKHGLPIWIEKETTYADGSVVTTFEKGIGND